MSLGEKLIFPLGILFYIYYMLNDVLFASGSTITIVVNFILLTYLCYYNFVNNRFWNIFVFIYIYLLFLILLIVLTSSNISYSFKIFLKYSIGLLALPVGFRFFGSYEAMKKMWFLLKVLLFLFIVNYLIANIYHIEMRYSQIVGASLGNIFEDGPYINLCIALIAPLFLGADKFKNTIVFLIIINVFLGCIFMKRSTIACTLIAGSVYYIYNMYFKIRYSYNTNEHNLIKKMGRWIAVIATIGTLFFSYQDIIIGQFEARQDRFQSKNFEKENRVREWNDIRQEIFNSSNFGRFLFGKETFNVVGTYGQGKFGKRNIHDNYGIILNGTGVIGFLWYFFNWLYIFYLFLRYSKTIRLSENASDRKCFVAFICIWIIFIIAGMSNTIYCSLYSFIHFLLTGMILRYFYEFGENYLLAEYDYESK